MKELFANIFSVMSMLVVGFFVFKFGWRIAPGILRGIIAMDQDGSSKMGCTLRPVFFLLVLILTIALGIGSMVATLKVVENFLPSTISVKIEKFLKATKIRSIPAALIPSR